MSNTEAPRTIRSMISRIPSRKTLGLITLMIAVGASGWFGGRHFLQNNIQNLGRTPRVMLEKDTNPHIQKRYGPFGIATQIPGSAKKLIDSFGQISELVEGADGTTYTVISPGNGDQRVVVRSLYLEGMPSEAGGINNFVYTNANDLSSVLEAGINDKVPIDMRWNALSPDLDGHLGVQAAIANGQRVSSDNIYNGIVIVN